MIQASSLVRQSACGPTHEHQDEDKHSPDHQGHWEPDHGGAHDIATQAMRVVISSPSIGVYHERAYPNGERKIAEKQEKQRQPGHGRQGDICAESKQEAEHQQPKGPPTRWHPP